MTNWGGKRKDSGRKPRAESGPAVVLAGRVPVELAEAARAAAAARGLTVSEWIAEAVAAHLAR